MRLHCATFVPVKDPKKVVFLCTGNICRSPMGEALLRHAIGGLPKDDPLKKLEVVSAGISAIDGAPPSPNSVKALEKIGIDISPHRARALTQELVDDCFALFAMDVGHLEAVKSRYKNYPERSMTVLQCIPRSVETDIPDPYGCDMVEYLEVRDDIIAAIPHIIKYLESELKKNP